MVQSIYMTADGPVGRRRADSTKVQDSIPDCDNCWLDLISPHIHPTHDMSQRLSSRRTLATSIEPNNKQCLCIKKRVSVMAIRVRLIFRAHLDFRNQVGPKFITFKKKKKIHFHVFFFLFLLLPHLLSMIPFGCILSEEIKRERL